ncbi:Cro/CI family transcriptional regulator [Salinarimonas rosea]|uniref:Cro/CI family transcriptional regulator n=1 Tax=Salinarimonas rosea TaxID=552063 RepID=UPI0004240854|nr:Cro/CI family transcriptional regulator [Salinarimonas rosea]
MRDEGLDLAIRAAGGVGALARTLGISQPSVSNWSRIPAERVLAVETATGVSRSLLRPDLYPQGGAGEPEGGVDEIDLLRAREYDLLAHLLGKAPTADTLDALRGLKGDSSPLGMAHLQLADAAARIGPEAASREYFDLFIGLGRGELLPYASFYLTGFLHERPLAAVRADLKSLGLEREGGLKDPEDHIAILCDVMAGLAGRRFDTEDSAERGFFERHLEPWAPRFFADLEIAPSSRLYRAVGAVGRTFLEIEAEAFEIGD